MSETTPFHTYEIALPIGWGKEEVKTAVENGARFAVFQYCITFILSFVYFSKAKLIPPGKTAKQIGRPYSLLTWLLGWWGPVGLFEAIPALILNGRGGVEITKDIVRAVNQGQFEIDTVRQLMSVHTYETFYKFSKPNKSDLKAFRKASTQLFETHPGLKKVWVGDFIDTDSPYFVLAVEMENDLPTPNLDSINEILRKYFYKHVRIAVVGLIFYQHQVELRELGVEFSTHAL